MRYLVSIIPSILFGCFELPRESWTADVQIQNLAPLYRAGDSIFIEGTITSSERVKVIIGGTSNTSGLTYFETGFYGNEYYSGQLDIKSVFGVGFHVTGSACSTTLVLEAIVIPDMERPSPRSITKRLSTRIEGNGC